MIASQWMAAPALCFRLYVSESVHLWNVAEEAPRCEFPALWIWWA